MAQEARISPKLWTNSTKWAQAYDFSLREVVLQPPGEWGICAKQNFLNGRISRVFYFLFFEEAKLRECLYLQILSVPSPHKGGGLSSS